MKNLAVKIALIGGSALTLVGLAALAAPAYIPFLPHRVQEALAGPAGAIDTTPGTVEELFLANEIGPRKALDMHVSHADVEGFYVASAKIWPWTLPPDFKFPGRRGIADTPGPHFRSMGLSSAFSKWATASLDAVKSGDLTAAEANELLDDVEDAYRTLFDAEVLSDHGFIERAVDPLRP